jgi:DNA-binding NarL/FixJ family response regulator
MEEAGSGEEALILVEHLNPDVILLNVCLPDLKGENAVEAILKIQPQARVIGMCEHSDLHVVFRILNAGAIGFILTTDPPQYILEAVRSAARNEIWLSPKITIKLIRNNFKTTLQPKQEFSVLSIRELEILQLIGRGYKNVKVANELAISTATVKNHLTRIYAKLGVQSRTEAVAWTWQHGLSKE